MHCDALQIFTQNQKGDQGTRTRGGLFGLGVLIGGATFAFGWERNCKKAEILAINDDGKEERKKRHRCFFKYSSSSSSSS